MAPWQNCLLGALVLNKYVNNPFTDQAEFDFSLFRRDIIGGVFFLNFVSSVNRNRHPLKEQRESDEFSRRIGLEYLGLADMLAMMNIQYGSTKSIEFLEKIMCFKALMEIYASSLAVEEFGRPPALEKPEDMQTFLDSKYIQKIFRNSAISLDPKYEDERNYIKRNGVANTAFGTVGPTGSIAILSDNSSSGCEPVYDLFYTRATRRGGVYNLMHGPILQYCIENNKNYNEIINRYIFAHDVTWEDRIAVQKVLQQYCDSSISSTVNLPEDTTEETIAEIFIQAWKAGLKGITIFRNNCKKGIFSKNTEKTEDKLNLENLIGFEKELLQIEDAKRHCIRWKREKLYSTVSIDKDNLPLEIFVKLPREAYVTIDEYGNEIFDQMSYNEDVSNWDGLCRLISKLLRYSVPLKDIIKQLDKSKFSMFSATGVLSNILATYLPTEVIITEEGEEIEVGDKCPVCGKMELFREAGCRYCHSCGFSSCG